MGESKDFGGVSGKDPNFLMRKELEGIFSIPKELIRQSSSVCSRKEAVKGWRVWAFCLVEIGEVEGQHRGYKKGDCEPSLTRANKIN